MHGKKFRAHRAAWILYRGAIPNGMLVLHRCDNPPCVNPKHLYLGTPKQNMVDKMRRGRFKTGVGTKQPGAKLHDDEITQIRSKYKEGITQRALSREYGVSQSVISTVINKKAWRHVV